MPRTHRVSGIPHRDGPQHLPLMSFTGSQLHQKPTPASESSHDGVQWKLLPRGINVFGSRYAIVCGFARFEGSEPRRRAKRVRVLRDQSQGLA